MPTFFFFFYPLNRSSRRHQQHRHKKRNDFVVGGYLHHIVRCRWRHQGEMGGSAYQGRVYSVLNAVCREQKEPKDQHIASMGS